MIYLDTSVALAHLFAEDRYPAESLWRERLVSSRLMEYELWTRVHARGLARSHAEPIAELLARVAFLELGGPVLARAREPFPTPVRTLDAMHLASADFLRQRGQDVTLATYDDRLASAARRMGLATMIP
jgi:predicted nucleic acid-binding protein